MGTSYLSTAVRPERAAISQAGCHPLPRRSRGQIQLLVVQTHPPPLPGRRALPAPRVPLCLLLPGEGGVPLSRPPPPAGCGARRVPSPAASSWLRAARPPPGRTSRPGTGGSRRACKVAERGEGGGKRVDWGAGGAGKKQANKQQRAGTERRELLARQRERPGRSPEISAPPPRLHPRRLSRWVAGRGERCRGCCRPLAPRLPPPTRRRRSAAAQEDTPGAL